MKIADLIENSQVRTGHEYDVLVNGDESVRDVLYMMLERGCEFVGVTAADTPETAVLSKDELLSMLLVELEGSYERLEGLNEQIDENFSNQSQMIEGKLKELIVNENNKLSVAVDYMQEGLIILDTSEMVDRANPSAKKFLALPEECDPHDVHSELDRMGFLSLLDNEPEQKDYDWGEYRVKNNDGRILQMRWTSIHTASEMPLGRVILLKDITDEQADEKAKTEFIAAITHELRTPLTIIQNSVSNILAGVTGKINRKTKQYLETILSDCYRFGGLISDLLDMSKIETGKMSINPSAVDLRSLVENAIKTVNNTANEKNISFVRKFDRFVPAMCIDRDRISQVVINLLSNAIRHSKDNSSITVRVNDRKTDVVFSVEDRGAGIAPGMQKQIFNKFHQIGREAGAGYKGAGLGLAICNGIMEMHGGSIWVESEPGLGSKFYISIPKSDVTLVLNKCIKELASRVDKKGGQFGLISMQFNSIGSEACINEIVHEVIRKLLDRSDSLLENENDLVFRLSDTEVAFVYSDAKKIKQAQYNICKIIGEIDSVSIGKAYELRMGIAQYPNDTREVIEMANLARSKSEAV